jgi:hypothetical protein
VNCPGREGIWDLSSDGFCEWFDRFKATADMAEKPDSSGATVFVQLELFGAGYRCSSLYVGRGFMREHTDYYGSVCVEL